MSSIDTHVLDLIAKHGPMKLSGVVSRAAALDLSEAEVRSSMQRLALLELITTTDAGWWKATVRPGERSPRGA